MIDVALKEWSCVCDLLVEGEVCLLLRKGGVHEDGGPGRFRLEHDRFALFPAWEHENLEWIKPELRPRRGTILEEPAELTIRGFAEVAGIWELPAPGSGGAEGGRETFDLLDDLHPWLSPQVDMRFDYKPERPLYVLLVRAFRLVEPKVLPNRPAFAGCRSWVPLEGADRLVDPGDTVAAMSAADLELRRARINAALG